MFINGRCVVKRLNLMLEGFPQWIQGGLWILLGMSVAQMWVDWRSAQVLLIPEQGRMPVVEKSVQAAYTLFGGQLNQERGGLMATINTDVEVRGIVLGESVEKNVALIKLSGKTVDVFRMGDELDGVGRVLAINAEGVHFLDLGGKERVFSVPEPKIAPVREALR
jgi:hypothetical protein